MQKLTDTYKLSNGVEIPVIGFGTWQTPDGETAVKAVSAALEYGYRHIDAAAVYGNEESVGDAIVNSSVAREDIFITGKVWNDFRGYDTTIKAFEKTLADLKTDYLDLYLIHWPAKKEPTDAWKKENSETWRALEDLYKAGRIKAIGVSNFKQHHIESLNATIAPMVNQIEFHPGFMQEETVAYCVANNILIEAWAPLGTGVMLANEDLKAIADKYNKSVAHLCIRWCLQHGTLPLPKSVTPSRIEDNTKVFDFVISDEDMATIDALPYIGGSGLDPDEIDF